MNLRPYQREAVEAIRREWDRGVKNTLLTLPTGCGKTIVFCRIIEDEVRKWHRVLILAHRGELLDQAADKLQKTTGLRAAVEKADQSCLGSWYMVTVGSVQSLAQPKRLESFPPDYFQTIIVDEAHHTISETYQRVLSHFSDACVLGVTATPDRGDLRSLSEFYESIAYTYSMKDAIRQGYLCPIRVQTMKLTLDLTGVKIQSGDYAAGGISTALDPYLEEIAQRMYPICKDRRTVVFLPLIKTARKFVAYLNMHGFRAEEVNGNSPDRAQVLDRFTRGETNVLCNAMLLTEGWDCPSVDTIIVLRPTKIRSLYSQMIGRGTRLSPETGKEYLLVLDLLWMTRKHDLCSPASLTCGDEETAAKMEESMNESEEPVDLMECEERAEVELKEEKEAEEIRKREESLARKLRSVSDIRADHPTVSISEAVQPEDTPERREKRRKLVDPGQYIDWISDESLSAYVPTTPWELRPCTDGQKQSLEKAGIFADDIPTAGQASALLDAIQERRKLGLSTPKQIRFLERRGFQKVARWPFEEAKNMMDIIAGNGWRTPSWVHPKTWYETAIAPKYTDPAPEGDEIAWTDPI